MALLPEFESEADMTAEVYSPVKLVHSEPLSMRLVVPSARELPRAGITLSEGVHEITLSVRFAEIEPQDPAELAEILDSELLEVVMAELAELREMTRIVEFVWSGHDGDEEWRYVQKQSVSELIGLHSDLDLDWVWWSQAHGVWRRAFEEQMVVRGAQQPFDDDTELLRRSIGSDDVVLEFKLVAPCADLALLRDEKAGGAVLIRIRGLNGQIEGSSEFGVPLPPFVAVADLVQLLGSLPRDSLRT